MPNTKSCWGRFKHNLTCETMKVLVTPKFFDDIGSILADMNFKYDDYEEQIDINRYDILILNCGTKKYPSNEVLEKYVAQGGIIYASDWTNDILEEVFGAVSYTHLTLPTTPYV